MVLTDREILNALTFKQIKIDPQPPVDAISSTAIDLTLSPNIRVWKKDASPGVERLVSPATPGYKVNDFIKSATEAKTIDAAGYVLKPADFLLAWTIETLELPYSSRLAARVEGKSSLARLGIGVHVTAPTIHAGFTGPIQLEVCNHGAWNVKLVPGMKVCQLIFELTVGTPNAGYSGQFQNQSAATH